MEPKKERRGCPPEAGTVETEGGGRIGNPPHVPTEEFRREVRTLAKVVSQEMIAQALKISVDTLQKYYREDFNEGKREAVAAVGAGLLKKALAGHTTEAIFYLKTQGGWSSRMELVGEGGGPIRTIDLTAFLAGKTEEELGQIEHVLAALSAAGGIDVPGVLGERASASEASTPPT